MFGKSIIIGGLVAAGLVFSAHAQSRYPSIFNYGPPQAPQAPQSWSYDPYTSGLGPCPQRRPSDEPCRYMIAPTVGQPSFWQD
jgi:hypothetical protein